MAGVLVEARGICKDFTGVRVLHDIDLPIYEGEIHAIIGENGAGKSTFVKILSGFLTPSKGAIYFKGQKVDIKNVLAARRLGISIVHQELNLAEDLTVEENLFLGREVNKGLFVDQRSMVETSKKYLAALQSTIDPKRRVRDLSIAEKQMVEIAKALSYNAKLLIMDEPTAVLTQHEIDVLFDVLRGLKKAGVTIVYISHRLREVKQICDRVTVFRDGHLVDTRNVDEVSEFEMASLMVGRDLSHLFPDKAGHAGEVAFEVRGLSIKGLIENVSFDVKAGEILGFAGLVGAGRTELAEGIMGLRNVTSGHILVNGREVTIRSPKDAMRYGIAYLSEDRKGSGIITAWGVKENVTLSTLERYCHPMIDEKQESDTMEKAIMQYDIRLPSRKARLEQLSGGNQQKVSLAKVMELDPKIIILDEPTRGIDVNTKQQIYGFIQSLAKQGKSCLVISSELPEIVGLCNRVVVMRNGRVSGILTGEDINEDEIIRYATGLKGGSVA